MVAQAAPTRTRQGLGKVDLCRSAACFGAAKGVRDCREALKDPFRTMNLNPSMIFRFAGSAGEEPAAKRARGANASTVSALVKPLSRHRTREADMT